MYPLESICISRQSNSAKSCKWKKVVATTEQQLLVAILSSLLQLLLDAEQRCSFPSWPFFHVEFLHFPNHEVSLSCREWSDENMLRVSFFVWFSAGVWGFFRFLGGFFVLMLCSKPSRMVFSLEILTQWANDCKYKTCRRLTEESEIRQTGSYVWGFGKILT